MATLNERARQFLCRTEDRKPLPASAHEPAVGVLGAGPKPAPAVPFSVFLPSHQERAQRLAAELMEIANRDPGEVGLERVLERAEKEAEQTSIELAKYALMVFITHHPEGQRLPIPPLEARAPEHVKPSPTKSGLEFQVLGALGAEAQLDWYREDADANDHHGRWHVVYPQGGIPDPQNRFGPPKKKDRQGELFFYMHQQMLARYDTERLALGLTPTTSNALSDFTVPIPEGYEPNLSGLDNRPANADMRTSTADFTVQQLQGWATALFTDVSKANATLVSPNGTSVVATPDLIGSTAEASLGGADPARYGNLHNIGHVIIGTIPDPANAGPQQGGVMLSTDVAIRDPVFYRWHRFIDDLLFKWQEKQPPQAFADAPKVSIRDSLGAQATVNQSPDVILCRADKVSGDSQAFGEQTFGGAQWDTDPVANALTTTELRTQMRRRNLDGETVQFLDHEDFFYFIRVRNEEAADRTITVRIFLAAKKAADDRRSWIELDKFQHKLKASQKAVIARSSKLSAAVRKPARRPTDPPPVPEPGRDANYCDCGWPYHLMLPRGKREGMDFRLLVVLTDWEIDKVEVEGKCGSMSFCGKRDVAYPDKRPMGYPFDRRWPQPISDTILAHNNMAARDIVIRLV